MLAQDREIHQKVNIPFLTDKISGAVTYSREAYHQYVKSKLIEDFCDLAHASYFFDDLGLIQRFKKLDRTMLKDYLNSESVEDQKKYLALVDNDEIRMS